MLISYIKRGAYNTFYYGLNPFIVQAVRFFFLSKYLLPLLSLTELGIWELYQSFFSYGTVILSSCAATGMIRFYLLYKDDPLKQKQAIGNSLMMVLLGATLFPLGYVSLSFFNMLPTQSVYLTLTVFSVSFFVLFSLVLAYLRVHEYLGWYSLLFCSQNFLALGLTLFGVQKGFGIDSFFYANCFSFLLFVPLFFYLLSRFCFFSMDLFKEQIMYSMPLFVAGFLYNLLMNIDRLLLKQFGGYDLLGTYGLLWRFGAIFQFLPIALMDAWPVVLFNAEKEHNGEYLITKLMNYICISLSSFCLVAIMGARCAIGLFFPIKYHFLVDYLPAFFLPILTLSIARFLHAGFGLSKKTIFVPFLTLFALGMQTISIILLRFLGLWGVFLGNTIAFLIYGICAYVLSKRIYKGKIINIGLIGKLVVVFGSYIALLQILFWYRIPWFYSLVLIASWPLLLLIMGIIEDDEKKWVSEKFTSCLLCLGEKLCATQKQKPNFDTILYLRTDICSDEIRVGGSVAHTLGVIGEFKKRGSKIICASSAMKSLLQKADLSYFKPLKVWPLFFFLRWKLGYLRWRLDCLCSNLFFTLQIRRLFKQYNIGVIYQRYSLLNCVGLILSRLYKIPLILEYNGSEVWAFDTWAKKHWITFNCIARFIERFNLIASDYIIVVSQVLKDDLVTKGIEREKILVNPNGVDPEQFDPTQLQIARNTIRKEFDIEDKFVFGFIGTFSYWHGIEVIAQMIPTIVERNKNVHFMLIGEGPLRSLIQNELQAKGIDKEHVTFTGLVPQHEAKQYLSTCDAFLSPTQPNSDGSRFFGSPTKMFEYLSMGKPIIASDLEQVHEIMQPSFYLMQMQEEQIKISNQIGILVDPKNTQGFVKAIQIILSLSETDRKKLGTNSKMKANKNYMWRQHVERIITFTSYFD